MNKLIFILIFMIPSISFSLIKGVPFNVETDARFNNIETLGDDDGIQVPSGEVIVGDSSGNANAVAMTGDVTISNAGVTLLGANSVDSDSYIDGSIDEEHLSLPTVNGRGLIRMARAVLDCATSSCVVGTVSMVTTLPANAVIYQSYWFTKTQFVDAGSGTVAFHCEDANNIFTAADITGNADNSIIAGNATGVIATMTAGIAAQCTVTATIATIEQTAGFLVLYIFYVVAE